MLGKYKPNGKGTLYIKGKRNNKYKIKYYGDFVDGNFDGNGKIYYKYREISYYEGEFKDNKRHGYGKYYYKDKLKYEGEFKNDEYDGKGKIYYKDGSYYEGGFANGKKNGEGKIYDKTNHIIEESEFENNIAPINGMINQFTRKGNLNELNNTLNEIFSHG